jgi:RND family efflux transporter MFP subunit
MMRNLLCTLAPSLLILSGCAGEPHYEKPLTPVTLYTVEQYPGESRPIYSGTVAPKTAVDVSFKFGGYVDHVLSKDGRTPIQEGDFVEKGAVLASLRKRDYEIKVIEAKSQVRQSEAGLGQARSAVSAAEIVRSKAQSDFERAGRLLKAESLTKVDFDAAKTGYDSAEQNLAAAQAQLELAKARAEGARAIVTEAEYGLADSSVYAPISGIVFKKNVEVGSLAAPGVPVFVLADTSSVKVIFGAPDTLLTKLKIGHPVEVTTEVYPDIRFPARITRFSPAADEKSRVFDAEVTIPNGANRLRAGMTVAIEVGEKTVARPVPVVPLTAVVRIGGDARNYSVFVAPGQSEQTAVQRRAVQLGTAYGNRIAVTSGLNPGERVVVSGATLLREGQQVRVVPSIE